MESESENASRQNEIIHHAKEIIRNSIIIAMIVTVAVLTLFMGEVYLCLLILSCTAKPIHSIVLVFEAKKRKKEQSSGAGAGIVERSGKPQDAVYVAYAIVVMIILAYIFFGQRG